VYQVQLLSHARTIFVFVSDQKSLIGTSVRSVTTLKETLMSQVPEKQKKLAALKKDHGSQV
jgi:hypothetical protein